MHFPTTETSGDVAETPNRPEFVPQTAQQLHKTNDVTEKNDVRADAIVVASSKFGKR